MSYLVQMKLATRPANTQEGIVFIEQYILPTLELCKKLEAEKKIVATEPLRGQRGEHFELPSHPCDRKNSRLSTSVN